MFGIRGPTVSIKLIGSLYVLKWFGFSIFANSKKHFEWALFNLRWRRGGGWFVRILGARYTDRDCFCFVQVHREPGVFVLFPEEHLRLGPLCRLLVLPADSPHQCLQIEKARLLILQIVHRKLYFFRGCS